MKTVVDSRLREQARRFELRFACDDCVHFHLAELPECSLGYPAAPRRAALEVWPPSRPSPAGAGAVEFCKSFELA